MSLTQELGQGGMVTLASAVQLVSWWKPLVLLAPFVPWLWLVSRIFDKHAGRFYLNRTGWNVAHMSVGVAALAVALLIPLQSPLTILISVGVVVLMLSADVAAFVIITNRDERVPANFRLKLDLSKLSEGRARREADKKQGQVELIIKGPDKLVVAPPEKETPEFALRVAAEAAFIKCLSARGVQLDLAPTGKDNAYGTGFMVDGVRVAGDTMPAAEGLKMLDFWKASARLDVAERRKKQVADLMIERGTWRKKVRLITMGGQTGQRLTLLIDPEGQVRRAGEELGLLEPQMKDLKALVDDGKGVVLLAAPLDMGRTTTMYAVAKMHDAYTKNVQTVELDIQDALEGVKQTKFDPQAEGAEFSTLVRSVIRRDPDVVALAELPDANTAKEVAKADGERTRIYVSLRADSALQALQMYVKAVGDPELAAKTLRGVVAQKLVRRLCTNCRVPYQPAPDMVKKLGLPADKVKQLFKKGGQVLIKNKPEVCPACGGGGYIGQEGVFEVFALGDAERAAVRVGDMNALKTELRKRQLLTIQQSALRKAIDGVTSVEEITRVTAEAQPAAGAAPAAAAAGGAAGGGKAPAAPAKPGA